MLYVKRFGEIKSLQTFTVSMSIDLDYDMTIFYTHRIQVPIRAFIYLEIHLRHRIYDPPQRTHSRHGSLTTDTVNPNSQNRRADEFPFILIVGSISRCRSA